MLTYILRRLATSVVILLVASVVIFFGVSAAGDPLAQLRMQPDISHQALQVIIDRKHLHSPLIVQYVDWLRDALFHGFGTTTITDERILPQLGSAMGVTVQLIIPAEVIAIVIAIVVAALAARKQYSLFDSATTFFSFAAFSLPLFWAALLLQILVTKIYNNTGYRTFYTAGLSSLDGSSNMLVDRIQHLGLPVIALAIASVAQYSRYARAEMIEVSRSDYVRAARARGLPERHVSTQYVVRNSLIPVTTVIGTNLGVVFGGAIVIEQVFGIPGMGLYFFNSLNQRDVYPLMAWLMVVAVTVVVFNLLTDLLYVLIDPRIQHG